jgi:nucleoside-diphosphate-sugar epimerase
LHTANNLVLALKHFPNIKQLIYTSSSAVYGNSNGASVSELSPVAPANRHGEILDETEQVLLSASSQDLKVCIFRLAAIYGSDREFKKRLSKLAEIAQVQAIISRTGFIWTTLYQQVSWPSLVNYKEFIT